MSANAAGSAWCPRCDALRERADACPACGTPLTTLEAPAPPPPPDPDEAPPAPTEPVGPQRPSRLRLAALAVIVALAATAFLVGRSGARAAPVQAAPPPSAAPTTTAPEPAGADLRQLGWQAHADAVTLTVTSARRLRTPDGDVRGLLTIQVKGLPAGQRLFGLGGLELVDVGGGAFSSPPDQFIDGRPGTAAEPTGDPDTYTVDVGPAPGLAALARIQVSELVVGSPATRRIGLGAAVPPGAQPLRPLERLPSGSAVVTGNPATGLRVRVSAAFVGDGRAVIVLDLGGGVEPNGDAVPLTARLEGSGRVLCARTVLAGQGGDVNVPGGLVLACPAGAGQPLAVTLGAGVQSRAFPVVLRPR
ncbi:MAG TPA: hypothetical protein VFD04_07290 [Actinomycetes bacterium]|jgi:hypothetical protein|nr:hypothetical protein [Actinomycetes bacterium]